MGQRHQTFVIIENPYIAEKKRFDSISHRDDVATYIKRKKELAELKSQLGTGKKTVLAYHHQWLYGATALAIVYNFLKFILPKDKDRSNKYSNPFHKEYEMDSKDKINFVTNLLRIHRFVEGFAGRDNGFENFHYLNKEEPEMREFPLNGDNNDGISIIDTTTGKYCFINDNSYMGSKKVQAKERTPLTALEYLSCYYPESILDENEDELEEIKNLTNEEREKKVAKYGENSLVVKKARQMFFSFELISLEELQDIFPKTFIKKAEKKAAKKKATKA